MRKVGVVIDNVCVVAECVSVCKETGEALVKFGGKRYTKPFWETNDPVWTSLIEKQQRYGVKAYRKDTDPSARERPVKRSRLKSIWLYFDIRKYLPRTAEGMERDYLEYLVRQGVLEVVHRLDRDWYALV